MGNYGCTCSSITNEEILFDNFLNTDFEEVIEFKPETYKHPKRKASHSNHASSKTTLNSDSPLNLEGELNRVQRSSKELLIPRWCILTSHSFKYFKNQFSAHCQEKPLLDVSIESIISGKAYRRLGRFYLEINVPKIERRLAAESSSKKLSDNSLRKLSKNSSFSSDRSSKVLGLESSVETLLFVASDRKEWERWGKGISSCIKPKF